MWVWPSFCPSGFLITLRYEADLRNGHTTYTAYLLKRLIRVVPLYLFVARYLACLPSAAPQYNAHRRPSNAHSASP
ncbi:MAG: hypothetical protein IPL28_22775 [Chloroflexi bacterium]|nr:hypothetical protein [Chloroflexota bacterium]